MEIRTFRVPSEMFCWYKYYTIIEHEYSREETFPFDKKSILYSSSHVSKYCTLYFFTFWTLLPVFACIIVVKRSPKVAIYSVLSGNFLQYIINRKRKHLCVVRNVTCVQCAYFLIFFYVLISIFHSWILVHIGILFLNMKQDT